MKLSELQEWIEQNSELPLDLEKASRDVPKLHGKAINIRANETALLRSIEFEIEQKKKERWIFYSGKAEPAAYKEEPFDIKVLKSDMDMFVDTDKAVASLRSKAEVQKIKIAALDEFLKSIGQRTFLIKSAIDYQRLMNGLT